MEENLNPLEKMLNSGHRIIAMESYEVDHICDLLLKLSLVNNKPYYIAQPERPMYRLGVSHINIPKTNSAENLLEHIEASQYFGVYTLRDYSDILNHEDIIEDLINIATGDTHKVVFMVAEHIQLPAQLKPYVIRSKHQMKETGQSNLIN